MKTEAVPAPPPPRLEEEDDEDEQDPIASFEQDVDYLQSISMAPKTKVRHVIVTSMGELMGVSLPWSQAGMADAWERFTRRIRATP